MLTVSSISVINCIMLYIVAQLMKRNMVLLNNLLVLNG